MYAGKVVEFAHVGELFRNPLHPYTYGLFESLPQACSDRGVLRSIPGSVSNGYRVPPGCMFHDRCSVTQDICRRKQPPWAEPLIGHGVRCWNPLKVIRC